MILASFLLSRLRQASTKISSSKSVSLGTGCLPPRRSLTSFLLVSVIPSSEMSMYEPLVWSRSGYRASRYGALFSSLGFWSLGVVDVAEFDRFRDRLDEDFFRASGRRSMVKSVVEVSSGQSCSSGQHPSSAQKATGSETLRCRWRVGGLEDW